jgi:enterochelin esterase-like enzyme
MKTRQAFITLSLLAGLWACSPSNQQTPSPTTILPTSIPTSTATITPTPFPPTPTSLGCLSQPGHVKQDSITVTNPAQEFLIYLPPCYEELNTTRYPVLYLLHGQTYTDDQWVRLGAADSADRLILSGKASPFIIVFPDDRYWNLPPGPGFGDRLIKLVIPYVDKNYRTLTDRAHRALGGLSRGGGWTVQLGFNHPELFGAIGLHSPAIFREDAPYLYKWIHAIPTDMRPNLWLDVGDADHELGSVEALETTLTDNNYLHEFHMYSGDHSEGYWSLHVAEYINWYAQNWSESTNKP